MSKDLKGVPVMTPVDDKAIAIVGHMDTGLSFYGPFDSDELAEKFIMEVVDPRLPSQWAYINDPSILGGDPALCMSCGKETCECNISEEAEAPVEAPVKLKVLKKPVEKSLPLLPASETVKNDAGKVIGDQLVIA